MGIVKYKVVRSREGEGKVGWQCEVEYYRVGEVCGWGT